MTPMIDFTDDDAKERLCREMQRIGLVEPGERQRWRLTDKGNAWGSALYGIACAMWHNGEPGASLVPIKLVKLAS
jgi:hypothetical protein